MASMTFEGALLPLPEVVPAKSAVADAKGFFARLMDAIVESRYRAAEREIARHRALMAGSVATLECDKTDLPFDHA